MNFQHFQHDELICTNIVHRKTGQSDKLGNLLHPDYNTWSVMNSEY
jgi:hypothetical protein